MKPRLFSYNDFTLIKFALQDAIKIMRKQGKLDGKIAYIDVLQLVRDKMRQKNYTDGRE